jgi:hypothetical protein
MLFRVTEYERLQEQSQKLVQPKSGTTRRVVENISHRQALAATRNWWIAGERVMPRDIISHG